MKAIKYLYLAAIFISAIANTKNANAQSIAIETDPATFAFNGYAIHARTRLSYNSEPSKWSVGIGAYSLKFPKVFRDIAIDNPPEGTKLQLRDAQGIFLDRSLSNTLDKGLFVGIQIAHQNYRLSRNSNYKDYGAILIMPRIGYEYPIGDKGYYIMPWAGIGYVKPDDSKIIIGSDNFKTKNWLPFATLHIGKRF